MGGSLPSQCCCCVLEAASWQLLRPSYLHLLPNCKIQSQVGCPRVPMTVRLACGQLEQLPGYQCVDEQSSRFFMVLLLCAVASRLGHFSAQGTASWECCDACVAAYVTDQIDHAAACHAVPKNQVVHVVVGTSKLALFALKLHPVNELFRNLMHASVLPNLYCRVRSYFTKQIALCS